jgi:hypothetical protein
MVVIPDRQATQPGGIGFLESILGLLKSLKIRALVIMSGSLSPCCTEKVLLCTEKTEVGKNVSNVDN